MKSFWLQVWRIIEHCLCRFYCFLGCHMDIDASEDSQKHLSYYIYCKHCKWKALHYYTGEKERIEKEMKSKLDEIIEMDVYII